MVGPGRDFPVGARCGPRVTGLPRASFFRRADNLRRKREVDNGQVLIGYTRLQKKGLDATKLSRLDVAIKVITLATVTVKLIAVVLHVGL